MNSISNFRRVLAKAWRKVGGGRPRLLHSPTISLHTAYHGTKYGGWTLFPDALSDQSIIYSFGIGEDASFDQEVMQTYGACVFAFDPTPRTIQWVEAQQWPPLFAFEPYGIAAIDGTAQFYPPANSEHVSYSLLPRGGEQAAITVPMLRLETIAKRLGHAKIDLLKMDIEGAEYEVIPDILSSTWLNVHQILVEFHHSFPHVSLDATNRAVQQLLSAGYHLFHVAPSGLEYSFIRRNVR